MGRKKIDIKYVEDDKERRVTFKTRVGGIVKKIYDLALLCKVKASIVLTDLGNNFLIYSNFLFHEDYYWFYYSYLELPNIYIFSAYFISFCWDLCPFPPSSY